MEYRLNKLIEKFKLKTITIHENIWISVPSIYDNIIIMDGKKYQLIDIADEDKIMYIENDEEKFYVSKDTLYDIIIKLKIHPEHYNIRKLLNMDICFRKKQEIETLALICDYYRGKYKMKYQHPELDFKMDMCLVINPTNIGGLVIEIDENNHNKYQPQDQEERQIILEGCGYYFVRIKPGQFTNKELITFIDNEINNYLIVYSKMISAEILWNKFKTTNIDKKLFDFFYDNTISGKKFCVDFDAIVNINGYIRKSDAILKLEKYFKKNIDYIDLKKNELIDNIDDIGYYGTFEFKGRGGHHKRFIFMTSYAMYVFIADCQTRKAKKVKKAMIDFYKKYNDLLNKCRRELIKNNTNNISKTASILYDKRLNSKNNDYKKSKDCEIKTLNNTIQELRRQKDELENINIIMKKKASEYETKYNNLQENIKKHLLDIKKIINKSSDTKTQELLKPKFKTINEIVN